MARTRPEAVSDELWARVEPLVPPAPTPAKGGRPRLPDRQALAAIVYVLRTGVRWNALPRGLGASSTVLDCLREWTRAGFFEALWRAGLGGYDELTGLGWEWQAADGVMMRAPFAGAGAGPNPTDRGKQGVKRSPLTDAAGIPLAVVVAGANRRGMKLLAATLDGVVVERPEPDGAAQHRLCPDAGYDDSAGRDQAAARAYRPHIRGRGEERALRRRTPG